MTNYGKVLKNNNQILRMNHERNKVGLILMILTVACEVKNKQVVKYLQPKK